VGFETFNRTEEKYQADIVRLGEIAQKVHKTDRSTFLKSLAKAWLHAFPSDKRILKPAWEAIVTKYSLKEVG